MTTDLTGQGAILGWSGGTYTRTNGTYSGTDVWAQDDANGYDIEATRFDLHDSDLATGINTCLTKDGQNSPSGHLNWLSTERAINSVTGSSSNYVAALANAPGSYFTGLNFIFRPNHVNTGASTINVNSLGAKSIKFISATGGTKTALLAGHLCQGQPAHVYYDGTDFILVNPCSGIWTAYTPTLGVHGSGTFGSTAITNAEYCIDGELVSVRFHVTGTIGGAPLYITITPPVSIDTAQNDVGTGFIMEAASANSEDMALIRGAGTSSLRMGLYNWAAISTAADSFIGSITYKAA